MIEKDGIVRLPSELHDLFKTGSHVTVRLISGGLSSSLKKLGVTEEEIERIVRLQMEERADVLRFLKSEGSLKRNRGFIRRASELLEERN
ncbi:MAG: hypothetical protein HYZ34_14695 [Ignavibacteriae bacterium]|nr:hypothetical protein [Ignavibacteriota bacterium]